MIKKMTKYSFVVFHREVDDFLRNLQEIGVVDITRQKRAIDSYSMDKFEEIAQCNAAAGALKRLKAEALKNKVDIPAEKPEANNLLALYTESAAQKEALKAKLAALKSELADALPWGAFTQEDLQNLEKLGLTPYFYNISVQKYNKEWESLYPIHILNEYEGKIYFAALAEDGKKPSLPLPDSTFPAVSADVLQKQQEECQAQAEFVERQLLSLTNCIEDLEAEKNRLFSNLDLYLANEASVKKADETIVIFEAFAPTDVD
ncbi:MAG: hypothetical protein IKB48_04880, partial [Bacteroidales bacterium]|nr:hypothetical protein [Bacteroidales bacterium]